MGIFVDPDNAQFKALRAQKMFVDKSSLLKETNRVFDSHSGRLCMVAPERFGKSATLGMMAAYYSCGCDSTSLFQDLDIAKTSDFSEHLNKHHVILLDIMDIYQKYSSSEADCSFIEYLQAGVIEELSVLFPEAVAPSYKHIHEVLLSMTSKKIDESFVFLIDEWDYLLRNPEADNTARNDFFSILYLLFEGITFAGRFSLIYMTGVLSVRRFWIDGTFQCSLDSFYDYSVLDPSPMGRISAFREADIKDLCESFQMPVEELRIWYGGYRRYKTEGSDSIYCPDSVAKALTLHSFDNFWSETSDLQIVRNCLDIELPGMKEILASLLAGKSVYIGTFDVEISDISCDSAKSVLIYLINMGYLGYDEDSDRAWIPNCEIRNLFIAAINGDS